MHETLVWVLFSALKLLMAYMVYQKFLKLCYLRVLYGRRGLTFMSTIPIPFIGDTMELFKRSLEKPDRPHLTAIFHERYGYQTPPAVGMYMPHGLNIMIQDPDYCKDLFQTYNEVFTKQDHA